jgi:cytoplasmic iron level regulating protein YaaA (DUF328/UPF0246 family)
MKTEEQIREKYNQMLEHTKLLMDEVSNHSKHDDVSVDNIRDHIRGENEQRIDALIFQYTMNALMEWILDIKK